MTNLLSSQHLNWHEPAAPDNFNYFRSTNTIIQYFTGTLEQHPPVCNTLISRMRFSP